MPHPKVIYAFGNYFWNLGCIDSKLGISCSLSAWHCNGFLMGCWAWLNALLDPAAIWWGMRLRFLAVWLRLQKRRSGTEKQKNQWALSGIAKAQKSSGAAKSCDMSHAVPWFGIQTPPLQSAGQADRRLRGFRWVGGCGFGCPIWPQTHFKSQFF